VSRHDDPVHPRPVHSRPDAPASATKVMSMRDAITSLVHDGDTLVIEGFTHLICFAAGHEIIRQGRRDLVLCRLTPDLIYDQMIGAGCARKLVFSWAGNPGAGSLHAFRRAVEGPAGDSARRLELEEYSHFGMVARLAAGAAGLPFWPMRDYAGTDLPAANPRIASVTCPYTGETLATVPALNPDVTIIHAQRADAAGNTQIWGLLGVQKEAAFASRHVIVVAEELVDERTIRADPNRTLIPGFIVDAVVHEPWGAHPSYAQGYYDRDNAFYVTWEPISRDPSRLAAYLDTYVMGVPDRAGYLAATPDLADRLRAADRTCAGVNYGY
jgi:glutaconate CoA-transferase subunit A